MTVIYKKKIYQGKVELRDYELRHLLTTKEPIRIYVGDDYMDLTYTQLKKGTVTNTQHSIINANQTYKLVGYDWKPVKNMDSGVDIYNAYVAMPAKIRNEIRKKLGLDKEVKRDR